MTSLRSLLPTKQSDLASRYWSWPVESWNISARLHWHFAIIYISGCRVTLRTRGTVVRGGITLPCHHSRHWPATIFRPVFVFCVPHSHADQRDWTSRVLSASVKDFISGASWRREMAGISEWRGMRERRRASPGSSTASSSADSRIVRPRDVQSRSGSGMDSSRTVRTYGSCS